MADENTIIFVAQEHDYDYFCVEKFFTTVGEYQKTLEDIYGKDFIGVEYSSLVSEEEFDGGECIDLITAMRNRDSIWFDVKYRSVWVKAIDESQPIPMSLLKVGSGDLAHNSEPDYLLEDPYTVFNMLSCRREDFIANVMFDEEVERAVEIQSTLYDRLMGRPFPMTQECFYESWDFHDLDNETGELLYELCPYFAECWSSCEGPSDLPDRLRALGVPERFIKGKI